MFMPHFHVGRVSAHLAAQLSSDPGFLKVCQNGLRAQDLRVSYASLLGATILLYIQLSYPG